MIFLHRLIAKARGVKLVEYEHPYDHVPAYRIYTPAYSGYHTVLMAFTEKAEMDDRFYNGFSKEFLSRDHAVEILHECMRHGLRHELWLSLLWRITDICSITIRKWDCVLGDQIFSVETPFPTFFLDIAEEEFSLLEMRELSASSKELMTKTTARKLKRELMLAGLRNLFTRI